MMNAILGSALGGVVAGGLALVAMAQGRPAPQAAWGPAAQPNSPYAMTVADTATANVATQPTIVQCDAGREATLQRLFVAGREVAQITCVSRTVVPQAQAVDPSASAPSYYQAPVGYALQPDIVERPVVRTSTVRPRARRVVSTQAREEVTPRRSWKKTALVIGGSAGAGAGIGALAGGKKGALIGAAIGGGSGAVYEVIKRKK